MSRIPRTLSVFDDAFANGPLRVRNRMMMVALIYEGGGQQDVTVTLDRLRHLTGTTTRQSCRNTLKVLRDSGWLTVTYGSDMGHPNTYHLNLARLRGEES